MEIAVNIRERNIGRRDQRGLVAEAGFEERRSENEAESMLYNLSAWATANCFTTGIK